MQVKPHIRYSQCMWAISYWRISGDNTVLKRLLQNVSTWGMWRNSPKSESFQCPTAPFSPIPTSPVHLSITTKGTSPRKRCVTLAVFMHRHLWALESLNSRCLPGWISLQPFSSSHQVYFHSHTPFSQSNSTEGWGKMEFQRQWIH